jgi:hypothetical protein
MRTPFSTLRRTLAIIVVLNAASTALAQKPSEEKLPPGAKLVRLEAQPATIHLKHPYDYAQLVVTGTLDNGDKIDVTRMAKVETPASVKCSPTGRIVPVSDGEAQLKLSVAGQTLTVPVKVSGQKEKYAVSFVRDVMPTMSKMGCNAGTCHGSAKGKNGFKLSLRGYDPAFDHEALTDDLEGRRFNRVAPDTSLMLLKPSGGVPHQGGVLMQPGERNYELLRSWIAAGAKLDLKASRVTRIDVSPKGPVVPLVGMKQQLIVTAAFSDGSTRDVTGEAFIESSNTEVAAVDKQALVTAVRRGESAMLARYEGNYAATTLIIMGDRSGFTWNKAPENNYIDGLVYEKLQQVKVLPSELCTDSEFVRRLYLDLTGVPPQPEQVRAFLADKRDTKVKRDELIDKLVGSPDYVEHWTNKWADLLQVNRKFLGEGGAAALRKYIEKAVADNMPYDKFVHNILTASGSTLDNPPAAYFKILRDPGSLMENTTQLFLAVRFNCNKCHDHPFERWTQDQYYQMAAYFARVGRTEDPKFKNQKIGGTDVEGARPLVEIIKDETAGEVKHDRTGAVTAPKFPYGQAEPMPPQASRREQLAKWVTSKNNQYFAKSYVNRLWSYLLGVGIIEPVDDIRAGNPPSNPKLLDRLTKEFIDSGFDTRRMFRDICKSRVYQQSIVTNKWNEDDHVNYSHAIARRLPAEVLYDAIQRAAGHKSNLPGLRPGARAAQLLDSNVQVGGGFFELFGKPPRESACECERSGGMLLAPILNLANGPVVGNALKDPDNRLAKILAANKDNAKAIEELYMAFVSRAPTEREIKIGVDAIKDGEAEYVDLVAERDRAAAALQAYEKDLPARLAAWEAKQKELPQWTVLDTVTAVSKGGASLARQADGSILASGKLTATDTYTVTTLTKLTGITGIRLEALSDPGLPGKGPGRPANGNFVLTEFKLSAWLQGDATKAKQVVLHKPQATFAQEGFPIANVLDNNKNTGWAIVPQTGKSHTAIFETKEPLNLPEGTPLVFTLEQDFGLAKNHVLGKFRLSVTSYQGPIRFSPVPEAILKIFAVPADQRTAEQKAQLIAHYRTQDAQLLRLTQALAEKAVPSDKRAVGLQDLAWAIIQSHEFLFNH